MSTETKHDHEDTARVAAVHIMPLTASVGATEHPGWAFYRRIGSPKYIAAPMVDQSELPFRMLCRRYGAQLCYTPMIHAACFVRTPSQRNAVFYNDMDLADRPVFAQFCGNDPDILLEAAKLVQDHVDAVDLNLGCPQGIARKGHYGAFLLDEVDLLRHIVSKLVKGLRIPVTCKIRLRHSMEATMELCWALVESGCSLLTVHGRTREQNKQLVGTCDWDAIRAIRQALPIPVFANGGVSNLSDAKRCLEVTGAAGVMSSEALLENPALFADNVHPVTGRVVTQDNLCREYLELADQYPPDGLKCIRAHLFKLLFTGLQVHTDLRDKLAEAPELDGIKAVAAEMMERRRRDASCAGRSWYWRHQGNGKGWNVVKMPPPEAPELDENFGGLLFGGTDGDDSTEGCW